MLGFVVCFTFKEWFSKFILGRGGPPRPDDYASTSSAAQQQAPARRSRFDQRPTQQRAAPQPSNEEYGTFFAGRPAASRSDNRPSWMIDGELWRYADIIAEFLSFLETKIA